MTFQIQRFANLSIDLIDVENQVREDFDENGLQALAEDIRLNGILQPIGVYEKEHRFTLVFGERRLRAKRLLGDKSILAAVLNGPAHEADVVAAMLGENLKRIDLNPIERAKGFQHLKSLCGGTVSGVAQRAGMAVSVVSESLALLELSPELQDQIRSGKLAASVAAELTRVSDLALRNELAEGAVAGEVTRAMVVARRKRADQSNENASAAQACQRVTAHLGQGDVVSVSGKDLNLDRFISLLENLLTRAKKVRPRGIELPTFCRMLREEVRA